MKKILVFGMIGLFILGLMAGCSGDYAVPTYIDNAAGIQTNVGREFIIALDANPTTGYNWNEVYDENLLKLVSKEYKADEKATGLVGAGGTQYYRFQAKHLGETNIKLAYQRNWESAPIDEKTFDVSIEARVSQSGGAMTTREYQIDGFTKIVVSAAFEVVVNQGDAYAVSVTASDFSNIKVEKVNDTLQIGRQGIEWFTPFRQQARAVITVPSAEAITFSGATKGTVNNIQAAGTMTLNVSGASNMEIKNITAAEFRTEVTGASVLTGDISVSGNARFEVNGASRIELSGAVTDVTANISGASRAELYGFVSRNADLEVSGASNAYVNLNGRLDANVSGASNLTWTGNPTMGDISTSGASNLRRK